MIGTTAGSGWQGQQAPELVPGEASPGWGGSGSMWAQGSTA